MIALADMITEMTELFASIGYIIIMQSCMTMTAAFDAG